MPAIQFFETVDSATGRVPAAGRFRFTPTRSRVIAGSPDEEVLPKPFTVTLDSAGKATVTLDVTGASWVWKVERFGFKDIPGKTEWVAVSSGDTEWPALVRVDPNTLTADPAAVPLWPVYTDNGDGTYTITTP